VWFAQSDSQFTLAGISEEGTKFHHITPQLRQRYAAEVEDTIISPPHHEPYTKLRLAPSKQQRWHQLLTLEEMGDRKPSQFLMHLRSLAPDMPDLHLSTIWFSRLPTKIQTSLVCRPELDLEAAAACADSITEIASTPALTSIDQPADNAELSKRVDELERQVAALRVQRNRPRYRDRRSSSRDRNDNPRNRPSSPRMRRPSRRSPSRHDLQQLSAGTTAASDTVRRIVPSPAPTTNRETNAADINDGTRLHYENLPPLHHRQSH
jgi:hypothetical protein